MFVPQTNVGQASSASSVDSRGFGFQTHFSSDPVAEKWLQTHFVLRFDGIMKCERELRKGGKFWLKYFEGTEKEKWSKALEFATVISNKSELTWQYRSCGLEIKNFTILPLSYVSQTLKTPIWSFLYQKLLYQKREKKKKKSSFKPHSY